MWQQAWPSVSDNIRAFNSVCLILHISAYDVMSGGLQRGKRPWGIEFSEQVITRYQWRKNQSWDLCAREGMNIHTNMDWNSSGLNLCQQQPICHWHEGLLYVCVSVKWLNSRKTSKNESLCHTLPVDFTCTQASLVGRAFLPHILNKDGVHGLQATPMEPFMRHTEDTMKKNYTK